MRSIGISVLLFIALPLLAQTAAKSTKSELGDSVVVRLDESWEPLTEDNLVDDFIGEGEEGLKPNELEAILKEKGVNGEKEVEAVSGFRVQLIATRDEEVARQARADALLNLPYKVYLIYDNPYYKIRVGDCLTHAEADSLQRLAINKGFPGAWIVRTTINAAESDSTSRRGMPIDSTPVPH